MQTTTTTRPERSRSKTTAPPTSKADERFTELQRKLDGLHKIHSEGKKSQESELSSTKVALAAAQKSNADLASQLEKAKKQSDAQDAHLQVLRSAALADQTEIKDLRAKLRLAETERTHLFAKHGEAGDAKRALHKLEMQRREDLASAEARRKEELRARDHRVAELEKALSAEEKRRKTAETRASELRGRSDGRAEQARGEVRNVETELKDAKAQLAQTQKDLQAAPSHAQEQSGQLKDLRALLSRVTESYSALSSSTIALSTHARLRNSHLNLQLRSHKLEQKLANSEAQIVELAQLIRQAYQDKAFALECLKDVEQERNYYLSAYHEHTQATPPPEDYSDDAFALIINDLRLDKNIADAAASSYRSLAHYYFLLNQDLRNAYRGVMDDLFDEQSQAAMQQKTATKEAASRAQMVHDMQAIREELATAQREYVDLQTQLNDAKTEQGDMRRQLSDVEHQRQRDASAHEAALRRDHEAVERLASAAKMHRSAEDALRAEISQLSVELGDLARYQEAYYALSDEIGSLTARHALAEDEAERLSQFNAEILSHKNPAQRIIYLDRVRRELADAKQELLEEKRAKESAFQYNDELLQELAIYKSVAVVNRGSAAADPRPKTSITRVMRVPLASQNLNG